MNYFSLCNRAVGSFIEYVNDGGDIVSFAFVSCVFSIFFVYLKLIRVENAVVL
jgi:hypothetical protein